MKTVLVVQGEFQISDRPDVVLTTLLGSCVAACLYDPDASVGGMNHFLLPGGGESKGSGLRYGTNAMELLINSLLKTGARRANLHAKLFGGAKMNSTSGRVGRDNAEFARWYLSNEGIPLVGEDLGGQRGRKLRFWPGTGRAQQMYISDLTPIADAEQRQEHVVQSSRDNAGDVTFL